MARHPFIRTSARILGALCALSFSYARSYAQLPQQIDVVKPAADDLKWQKIPWVTDLAKGQSIAQAERRPIFLWVTGDDPLERC